ncbi:hypothetical protein HLB23_32800 [Nocardia uniformis]|uniref:Uncharacterized protein n=1 Tax=Nocardia uniformis TaxID=53432 RepID=A0A849C7D5_9NOCA|nr:hypothetical protein [Nocardia uniformis]NNH74574.1 hypothetical protein [Nocardia uniformis]
MTEMNRLTADDDLFWKVHRLYGPLLVVQLAWLFDEPLERATVQRFHEHLSYGFLARRVVTTRFPLARPWWAPALRALPLDWRTEPVRADRVPDWLAAQTDTDLDPITGEVWRLSAAPTATGGTVLSLVASHVAVDGGGGLFAVADALERLRADASPDRAASAGRLVGDTLSAGLLRAHIADAVAQVRAVAAGIRGAIRARAVHEPVRQPRPETTPVALANPFQPADLLVSVPAADWNRVAAAHSGTANGLMVGVAVGVLGRSGRVTDGAVRVEIPRSMRGLDDPRGNASTGVAVAVPYRHGERTDLARLRAATKRAVTAHDDPATTPPLQHLQPVQVLLPDALTRRFVRTSKAPICLCTNLGDSAKLVADIAGIRARAVVMRPVVRAGDPEFFRRAEAGLTVAYSGDGETVTLAVAGVDPDRFPDRDTLRRHVAAELTAWGLRPRFW